MDLDGGKKSGVIKWLASLSEYNLIQIIDPQVKSWLSRYG